MQISCMRLVHPAAENPITILLIYHSFGGRLAKINFRDCICDCEHSFGGRLLTFGSPFPITGSQQILIVVTEFSVVRDQLHIVLSL